MVRIGSLTYFKAMNACEARPRSYFSSVCSAPTIWLEHRRCSITIWVAVNWNESGSLSQKKSKESGPLYTSGQRTLLMFPSPATWQLTGAFPQVRPLPESVNLLQSWPKYVVCSKINLASRTPQYNPSSKVDVHDLRPSKGLDNSPKTITSTSW